MYKCKFEYKLIKYFSIVISLTLITGMHGESYSRSYLTVPGERESTSSSLKFALIHEIDITPEQISNFIYMLKNEFSHRPRTESGKITLNIIDLGDHTGRVSSMLKKYLENNDFEIRIFDIDTIEDDSQEPDKYTIEDIIRKFGQQYFDIVIWSRNDDGNDVNPNDINPLNTLIFKKRMFAVLKDDGLAIMRPRYGQDITQPIKSSPIISRINNNQWKYKHISNDLCQFPRDVRPDGSLMHYDDFTLIKKELFKKPYYNKIFIKHKEKREIKLDTIVQGVDAPQTMYRVRDTLVDLPEKLYFMASINIEPFSAGVKICSPENGICKIIVIDSEGYELPDYKLEMDQDIYNTLFKIIEIMLKGNRFGIVKSIYYPPLLLFLEMTDNNDLIIGQNQLITLEIKKPKMVAREKKLSPRQLNTLSKLTNTEGAIALPIKIALKHRGILSLDYEKEILPRWEKLTDKSKGSLNIPPDKVKENFILLSYDFESIIYPTYYYLTEISLISQNYIRENPLCLTQLLNSKIRPRSMFLLLMNIKDSARRIRDIDSIFDKYLKTLRLFAKYKRFLQDFNNTEGKLNAISKNILKIMKVSSERKSKERKIKQLQTHITWLRIYVDKYLSICHRGDSFRQHNEALLRMENRIAKIIRHVPLGHKKKIKKRFKNIIRNYTINVKSIVNPSQSYFYKKVERRRRKKKSIMSSH